MKKQYEEPTAEVLIVRMEQQFLISNQEFQEDDDDIFGDGND